MKKKRVVRKASFPRLREIREELGWEVPDILVKLQGGKPSIASIYRLEQGHSLRVANARRVFDVINQALGVKLDPKKELKIE
jgi:hypothetical protein